VRSGISYPSHTGAAYVLTAGAAVADFPVTNLDDKLSIRSVFRAAAGAVTVTYTYGAAVDVRFLGILHHNAPAGATFRHRLRDVDGVQIYDSGALPFYPAAIDPFSYFPPCTPHVLETRRALSGTLELSAHPTGWQIGGLEVAGWWEWPDVNVPREFGLTVNDAVSRGVDGADHGKGQFNPRLVAGTRENVDAEAEEDAILRFQRRTGLRRPFVWVWDYADPDTWSREVILVRNSTLPPFKRKSWPAGSFSFRFEEHLR
jgi:hypothetical protein